MTVSWTDDDEFLLSQLRAAAREQEAVPEEFGRAARAAFTWRTVDAELLALTEAAALSAPSFVRGEDTAQRRVLEFRGARCAITLELSPGAVEGQIVPVQDCRLRKAALDGEDEEVSVDDSGFFRFPVRADETYRLRLEVDGSVHVTQWVTP